MCGWEWGWWWLVYDVVACSVLVVDVRWWQDPGWCPSSPGSRWTTSKSPRSQHSRRYTDSHSQEVYRQAPLSSTAANILINNENFIQTVRATFLLLSSSSDMRWAPWSDLLTGLGHYQWGQQDKGLSGQSCAAPAVIITASLMTWPTARQLARYKSSPEVLLSHRCGPVSSVLFLAQSRCLLCLLVEIRGVRISPAIMFRPC